MGMLERLRSQISDWFDRAPVSSGGTTAAAESSGATVPPLIARSITGVPATKPRPPVAVQPSDFVSQAGDVPRVVVGMLERNGNVLVETRAGKTATRDPCTEYLFRDPLVLTAAQHRAVKKYITRCNPDRAMDGFAQLGAGGHGDRFTWIDSEDERRRRAAEAQRAEDAREERAYAEVLRARIDAAVREGTLPPRPPPLVLSEAAVAGLDPSLDCDVLDVLLESLGVDFLLNEVQPDDVAFRILDRDVLLPRALFECLHEAASPSDIPPGREISITLLKRRWDCYSVADDMRYGEVLLERLEPRDDPA